MCFFGSQCTTRFYRARYASAVLAVIVCVYLSVCLSVTSRSRTKIAKPMIMSRAIDGFAPSTDSAAPSTDPSMAQQSVDGAALSVDTQSDSARKNNAYLTFLYGV